MRVIDLGPHLIMIMGQLQSMADQIVSRGPDNSGVWTSVNDGFAYIGAWLLLIYLQPVNLWFHLVSDMCWLQWRDICILTYIVDKRSKLL